MPTSSGARYVCTISPCSITRHSSSSSSSSPPPAPPPAVPSAPAPPAPAGMIVSGGCPGAPPPPSPPPPGAGADAAAAGAGSGGATRTSNSPRSTTKKWSPMSPWRMMTSPGCPGGGVGRWGAGGGGVRGHGTNVVSDVVLADVDLTGLGGWGCDWGRKGWRSDGVLVAGNTCRGWRRGLRGARSPLPAVWCGRSVALPRVAPPSSSPAPPCAPSRRTPLCAPSR
jgi:hypothetical protein